VLDEIWFGACWAVSVLNLVYGLLLEVAVSEVEQEGLLVEQIF